MFAVLVISSFLLIGLISSYQYVVHYKRQRTKMLQSITIHKDDINWRTLRKLHMKLSKIPGIDKRSLTAINKWISNDLDELWICLYVQQPEIFDKETALKNDLERFGFLFECLNSNENSSLQKELIDKGYFSNGNLKSILRYARGNVI